MAIPRRCSYDGMEYPSPARAPALRFKVVPFSAKDSSLADDFVEIHLELGCFEALLSALRASPAVQRGTDEAHSDE
jgi:hypothetical protein